jgi:hypothetical protein
MWALITNRAVIGFIIIVVGIVAIGLVTGGVKYDTSSKDWIWNFNLSFNGQTLEEFKQYWDKRKQDIQNSLPNRQKEDEEFSLLPPWFAPNESPPKWFVPPKKGPLFNGPKNQAIFHKHCGIESLG